MLTLLIDLYLSYESVVKLKNNKKVDVFTGLGDSIPSEGNQTPNEPTTFLLTFLASGDYRP